VFGCAYVSCYATHVGSYNYRVADGEKIECAETAVSYGMRIYP